MFDFKLLCKNILSQKCNNYQTVCVCVCGSLEKPFTPLF